MCSNIVVRVYVDCSNIYALLIRMVQNECIYYLAISMIVFNGYFFLLEGCCLWLFNVRSNKSHQAAVLGKLTPNRQPFFNCILVVFYCPIIYFATILDLVNIHYNLKLLYLKIYSLEPKDKIELERSLYEETDILYFMRILCLCEFVETYYYSTRLHPTPFYPIHLLVFTTGIYIRQFFTSYIQ